MVRDFPHRATIEVLSKAIEQKQRVSGSYKGYQREMCPHALGTRAGRWQCLFFQFAGGSSKGLPPGGEWRCIPLNGLTISDVYDGLWHSAPYSQAESCHDHIVVEVEGFRAT
jgi:hypothetical protein